MYRIVSYLGDIATRCAYLRETAGDYQPTEIVPFVVCAREYDDSGACTRTWFLGNHQSYDGSNSLGDGAPTHRIVDSNILPGEESKPPNPMTRRGDLQAVLHTLKQHQIKDAIKIRQTETFCRTYNDALRRAANLEVELKTADENVRNLAERNSALATELQATKAELAALREQKSLTQRVRAWFPERG